MSDRSYLADLMPSPFGTSASLPTLMRGIAAGEIDRATGMPIARPASPPPTAVLDADINAWNREKAVMRDEMRETLLRKAYGSSDPSRAQRFHAAAQQLQGE